MKFEFRNLGTIKKTTLDLRPLTVIVGPNNTNKTYLAYCLHGMLRQLEHGGHPFLRDGNARIRVPVPKLLKTLQRFLREEGEDLSGTLPHYFQDTYGESFKRTEVSVPVDEKEVRARLLHLVKEQPDVFEMEDDDFILIGDEASFDRQGVARDFIATFQGTSLTLPAERNALIITYKMLSTRRYRLLRDRDRRFGFARRRSPEAAKAVEREMALLREQGDIRYPAPIEDFLDFLTDVELNAARPINGPDSPFGKLASTIETHIQSGHRTGYQATTLGGAELALTVGENLRIDLYNASSSIKQLAPLLLFLRYRAAPGQTLIIDEPEMNLHPEGQAKLLEALAMLANLGVHVLLTTHSPYFMTHLNTLIASDPKSKTRQKRQAKHLYMGDAAAFLAPDDVSAYEMQPHGLVSLAEPEYGIRWDTLSDVFSELQRRFFAIVEEPQSRATKKA